MISIFNRMTKSSKSDLDDCSLFEDIMDTQYEKFKFFYEMIKDMALEPIKKIECSKRDSDLVIVISFKNKGDRDEYYDMFSNYENCISSDYTDYFALKLDKSGVKLNISIENKSISREEEIYENRFNSR